MENNYLKAMHKIREYSNLGFYSKKHSNKVERHFIEYKELLQKLVDEKVGLNKNREYKIRPLFDLDSDDNHGLSLTYKHIYQVGYYEDDVKWVWLNETFTYDSARNLLEWYKENE